VHSCAIAEHIVEQKEGEFAPETFVDRYETAFVEITRKKEAHKPPRRAADRPSAPRNVVNLMDALRRSVQVDKVKEKKPAARPPARRKAG